MKDDALLQINLTKINSLSLHQNVTVVKVIDEKYSRDGKQMENYTMNNEPLGSFTYTSYTITLIKLFKSLDTVGYRFKNFETLSNV